MARNLNSHEYYKELAKRTGCSAEKIRDIWNKTVDFWVDEIHTYGTIDVPLTFVIQARVKGGRYRHIPKSEDELKEDDSTKVKTIYLEPYQQLAIMPKDGFKDEINGKKLTKEEINRQKAYIRYEKEKSKALKEQREILTYKQNMFKKVKNKRKEEIRFYNLSKAKQKEIEEKKKQLEYGEE